ncbi:MAG: DNA polymerase III subunit gamma/tau, partial [Pseudomonadota bacterium]|nr:DNA polymerase III subunit gamma/tau [Pseudomonadota bacterium]
FQAQYELGADPAVIIADLAELTHWITRLKYVPGANEDVSFSQSARARGRSAADMLSTRVLSRAWQVLLKGHEETQAAFNTRAAADMILIRLAHMADTPTPDELVRQYESAKPAPSPPASASLTPASSPPSAPTAAASSSLRGSASPVALGAVPEQAAVVSPTSAASQPAAQIRLLESFEALLELVSEKRDLGLKHALEHGVHLVHFEAAQADKGGRLEIRLAGEQANIAQDLTRKLREWTGQNWMVSLSSETGDQTIASRRQTAADIRHEAAMADPLVKAALDVFPDARIEAITELDEPALSPADTDAGGDTDIGGEDA